MEKFKEGDRVRVKKSAPISEMPGLTSGILYSHRKIYTVTYCHVFQDEQIIQLDRASHFFKSHYFERVTNKGKILE